MKPALTDCVPLPAEAQQVEAIEISPLEMTRELSQLAVQGISVDPQLAQYFETYRSDQAKLGKIIASEDPIHQKLEAKLHETIEALGGNPADFSMHVLRESTVNAFVFPGVAPAPVFLTTGLLDALATRYGEVTKGHLALLFGHESAHVRDGAYTPPKSIDPVISRTDVFESRQPEVERVKDESLRLLELRAGGRNEEYECDKAGILAARRIGASEAEPIEVLKLLAEREEASKKSEDRRSSYLSPYAAVMEQLLSTHPASQRRVDKGVGHQRLLTTQGELVLPDSAREPILSPAELAPLRASTALQQSLATLTTELSDARRVDAANTIIMSAMRAARDITELQNVAIVAGLHLQAISSVEFSRFERNLRDKDQEQSEVDLDKSTASIQFLHRALTDFAQERARELAPVEYSEVERAVLEGMVASSLGGVLTASTRLEKSAQQYPKETIQAFAQCARLPFENGALHPAWKQMVYESTAAADASEIFASGQFDQRAEFLATFVVEARLTSEASMSGIIETLGAMVQSAPELLANDKQLQSTLLRLLYKATQEGSSHWPDSLQVEDYQSARAATPPHPGDPFCSALPLSPLMYQAGRNGNLEVFQAMASDQALPEQTRSVLGTIYLNAWLNSGLSSLPVQERGERIRAVLQQNDLRIDPVPLTEGFPTSHSLSARGELSTEQRILWKSVFTSANYDKLPVYHRGFSRTIELLAQSREESDTALPALVLDSNDSALALIGTFAKPLREVDSPVDLSRELVNYPELVKQINYASANVKNERAWIEGNDWQGTPDSDVKTELCRTAETLQKAYAAGVDRATIRNQDLGRLLDTYKSVGDPIEFARLLERAQTDILPTLARAKEFVGSSRHDYRAHFTSSQQANEEIEQTLALYSDYHTFSETRLTPRSVRAEKGNTLISTPDSLSLENITFLMGRSLFDLTYRYGTEENASAYAAKSPAEKVACIQKHFIAPSAEKDRHLLEALKEIPSGDHHLELKREIFDALYSTVHAARLGLEIYETQMRLTPRAQAVERLEDILTFLPSGSAQREKEIRALYDGRNGEPGLVTSWAEHKAVQARLETDSRETQSNALLRGTGVDILLNSLRDERVPASERARVLLWVAGLRESTVLVECVELATERRIRDLKKESDLLTSEEKEAILYEALAGPEGILRDQGPGRDIFLNTLFIGVFKPLTSNPETLRQCKACFDTIMKLDEPERAARFLATCMVGYLEKLDEPEQVKLLFSSYGALGPKAAQQIIARTTLFSAETREALMDLTSRVPGGSCAELYDALERKYGADAERFIMNIKPTGGGSFQQVWEVTLWNEQRTGPGESLICCKLRPNVIVDLGGDLRTTQGLADAMEAAPELFGGAHLNRRAGQVIALQSALETDYQFIVSQQEGARAGLGTQNGKRSTVKLSIPEVVRTQNFIGNDGTERTVELTNGEFIFMKKAPGVTLDKYLTENPGDKTQVYRALAQYTIRQALSGGYLHCDLHPGNIIVERSKDGAITLSLIDWGISAKTPQLVSEGMQHILRITAGAADEGFSWRNVIKNIAGAKKIDEASGVEALADFVHILGAAAGQEISPPRARELGKSLYDTFNRPDAPLQEKLQAIEPILAEAQISMPLSVDYMLRGLATLKYVWEDLGEKEIWGILKSELKHAEESTKQRPLNKDLLRGVLSDVAADCGIDSTLVSAAVTRVERAGDRNAQLSTALAELREMYATLGKRDGLVQAIEKLRDRSSGLGTRLGDALGIQNPAELLDEVYTIDRLAQSAGAEFRAPLPPLSTVQAWCKSNKIGHVQETWSAPVHPGTVLRVSGGGKAPQLYVTLYGPACDDPRECQVIALDSMYAGEHGSTVSAYPAKAVKDAKERADGAERSIPSVVRWPKTRQALVEVMQSFDVEGRKIEHLLREPGRKVEYFTGEEWRDLRELRLA